MLVTIRIVLCIQKDGVTHPQAHGIPRCRAALAAASLKKVLHCQRYCDTGILWAGHALYVWLYAGCMCRQQIRYEPHLKELQEDWERAVHNASQRPSVLLILELIFPGQDPERKHGSVEPPMVLHHDTSFS